jgi:S-methylmethionine-dependent homocysteine/selenocysteine methylase
MQNPIIPFLKANDAFVLDGGLATELENRGHNLNDSPLVGPAAVGGAGGHPATSS